MISKQIINKLINKNILFSYSGGLDSTVLLHKLIQIKNIKNSNFFIRAIHINHQINIKSDLWSLKCKIQCKFWKIPLIIKKVNLNFNKYSIEEAARKSRYKVIKNNIKKNEILITAHNLNDNLESILLNIKRGCSINGLIAMKFFKKNIYSLVLRPFINKSHIYIKKWANFYKLIWIQDKSNFNILFDRNFLRNKVIPLLKIRWSFIFKTIYRTSKLWFNYKILLNNLIINFFNKFIFGRFLKINNLLILNRFKRNILLKYWLFKNKINISFTKKKNKVLIYRMLTSKKKINFKLNINYKIYKINNFIYLKKINV